MGGDEDRTIRIFDHGSIGYLTAEGTISTTPAKFSAPIYCIYSDRATGDIWLGSKPDGLYRLQHRGGVFAVSHIETPKGFSMNEIYDITTDSRGRQWLATMDNGLVCIDHGRYSAIHYGRENKVRKIVLPDPTTLVAVTTEGLLTVDITPGHGNRRHLHRREPNRASSLSNNACMDIAAVDGKWYVATESGGVNMTADRITAPSLTLPSLRPRDGTRQRCHTLVDTLFVAFRTMLVSRNEQVADYYRRTDGRKP